MLFIGEHCERLQRLYLKEVGPESHPTYVSQSELIGKKLFRTLTSLHLSGRQWNPSTVLTILLSHALKIESVSLLNLSSRFPLDGILQRIQQHNPLNELQSVNLYSGCLLSLDTIRQLTFGLPQLTSLYFLQNDDMDISEVEALRTEAAKRNLNVKLCCLELI